MGELSEGGMMVALEASEAEVQKTIEGMTDRVAIAAVNGPGSVVISGDEDIVISIESVWRERGAKTKHLSVSHAFHSPRMDGMLDELREVATGVAFNAPQIPIVSNLTGEPVAVERICSAEYWVEHVRKPVRFADGIGWLRVQGVRSFLELGPDGVLSAMSRECLDEYYAQEPVGIDSDGTAGSGGVDALDGDMVVTVPLLRGGRPEAQTVMGSLAELWVRGVGVDWAGVFGGSGARRVRLPTYAFQRERYWLSRGLSGGMGDMAAAGQSLAAHPLLGAMVELADGERWLFTGRVSLESHPWLADYVVLGGVLFPETAFLDLALGGGRGVGCGVVRGLPLDAPLFWSV